MVVDLRGAVPRAIVTTGLEPLACHPLRRVGVTSDTGVGGVLADAVGAAAVGARLLPPATRRRVSRDPTRAVGVGSAVGCCGCGPLLGVEAKRSGGWVCCSGGERIRFVADEMRPRAKPAPGGDGVAHRCAAVALVSCASVGCLCLRRHGWRLRRWGRLARSARQRPCGRVVVLSGGPIVMSLQRPQLYPTWGCPDCRAGSWGLAAEGAAQSVDDLDDVVGLVVGRDDHRDEPPRSLWARPAQRWWTCRRR